MITRRLFGLAVATAAAALLLMPAGASAGVLVSSAPSCDSQTLAPVFLPWADAADYTLLPGGSFEHRSTWSLAGASVTSGNEPFDVGGSSDSHSLSLPNGARATSGSICVGIEHPDIRFFARSTDPLATLHVDVLFEDAAGNVQSAPIGAVAARDTWAPTAPLPIVVNLLPLLPDSRTAVAFRFSANGGSFQIDDVYVDPYKGRL